MTQDHDRQLSELLDGELDDSSASHCLRRYAEDRGYRARFSRYTIIRDCLRRDPPGMTGGDLGDRVMAALENEPVVLAPRMRGTMRHAARRLLKPAAGVAIAASVATVAVLGLRDGRLEGENAATPAGGQRAAAISEPAAGRLQPGAAAEMPRMPYGEPNLRVPVAHTASATDRAWLNNYLLRHNEAADAVGRTGFIPYVHIVTRDSSSTPDTGARTEGSRPVELTPE